MKARLALAYVAGAQAMFSVGVLVAGNVGAFVVGITLSSLFMWWAVRGE